MLFLSIFMISGILCYHIIYNESNEADTIGSEITKEVISGTESHDAYNEPINSGKSIGDANGKELGNGVSEVDSIPSAEKIINDQIADKLSEMSIEEKIYQLFIVTPEILTGVPLVVAAGETTKNSIEKTPVGGIVYLASNFTSIEQTKEMLLKTQEYSREIEGMPLFLCVDEEGGRVTRIAQNPAFGLEKIEAMANVSDVDEAYAYGETVGTYLADLGINVDFAPVADVLTNSNNTVIGDRSFGSDPMKVCNFAKAYSDGLHVHGIMSTYKHFPGHGATEADTHKGYAYTEKELDELYQNELIPFSYAQEYGIDMVMVAHISLPNVIGDDTPCSLSKMMISDVLREEMAYDGIIITDALNMGAITEKYSTADAALNAFEAGADMLLMPGNLQEAYSGLYNAYTKGEISEERINESLRRIIKAKMMLTMYENR